MTVRRWTVESTDGPDGLRRGTCRRPSPGPRQVLVRMRAWSLNHRDLLIAQGRYGPEVRRGVVPLSDGAGEVVEAGAEVTRWCTGDRVTGTFLPRWISGPPRAGSFAAALGGSVDGVLADHVVFDEDGLVAVPAHLDLVEAATLPCAAVTAWQAVVELGGLRPGQTVLVQGSGGVAVFALQLAVAGGARVVALSGSDAKLRRLGDLGADVLLNYRTVPDWGRAVADLTGGGVDTVVEVGGRGTLRQSLRAVRTGGFVAVIGVLDAGEGPGGGLDPVPMLRKALRLSGVYVGSRDMFEALNRALAQQALRPVLDRAFPFSAAPAAYRHLASGQHVGKVVLHADDAVDRTAG